MIKIGIICEYNPFHNGHIYHINKIKEMYPNSLVILVMSSCYTERGELSVLNKWDKTKIALNHKIDLVVELPFTYATESADIFSEGAIKLLSYLQVDYLIFGSESNDIDLFNELVNASLYNKEYDHFVKKYMDLGYNYPVSVSKSLEMLTGKTINSPNDLLGLSYIKAIKKMDSSITPLTIKRTNDYHSTSIDDNITSASTIRQLLKENRSINHLVPSDTMELITKNIDYEDNYFKLLKYKIISDIDNLNDYLDVDEGLSQRIKKNIIKSNTYHEFIENLKTKRYTYNRLNRMFIHILTGLTKEMATRFKVIEYIRILGFNKRGSTYLRNIKKEVLVPIITNYSNIQNDALEFELRVSFIYNEIFNFNDLNNIEIKSIPIKIE